MNWRGLKLQALVVVTAFVVFAAATPVQAACPPFARCVQYITWQRDAYGRPVPVLMSVPVEQTFVYRAAFAQGRLLPEPIMTAVSSRHPCGQITGVERRCRYWKIKLCDQGREFEMKVCHDGRVLLDKSL